MREAARLGGRHQEALQERIDKLQTVGHLFTNYRTQSRTDYNHSQITITHQGAQITTIYSTSTAM
jgi:predicted transcriptional regulator